jgi:hypothetical protein
MAFVPLEERPLERWIFAFFRAIYTPTEFSWKKTVTPVKYFQDEAVGTPPASASPAQEAALSSYLANTKQNPGLFNKLDGAEQGFLAAIGKLFTVNKTIAPAPAAAAPAPVKQELKIPVSVPIKIPQQGTPHLVVEERPSLAPSISETTQEVNPIMAGEEFVSTRQAIFSVDAAPPNPPTIPNVIVGQVVDEGRRIIEGAIMEIRDEAGRPVRALRSNKVGHFITVTPLDAGRYQIATEKDGYQFAPVSFEATGVLIPPILVQGKSVTAPESLPIQQTVNQMNNQTVQQAYANQ